MKILFLLNFIILSLISKELIIGENSFKTLNIYNNISFMQEQEMINSNNKIDTIIYKNIPSSIITDSINIINDNINILTQKYYYNKPTMYNILKTNIGKEINFYLNYKKYTSYQFKKGILLNVNNNFSLIQDNNFIYKIPNNQIQIKKLPNNFYINPFLKWKLSNNQKINNSILKLNYLLNNITYNCEYNVYLDNNNSMKLNGWFNIKNSSGIDFKNINLNIIAGTVNNIDNYHKKFIRSRLYKSVDSISHENINLNNNNDTGIKIYPIKFKVSLQNNQNTQINFINKTLKYQLINKFNFNLMKKIKNLNAKQYINFQNTTNNSLPKGNIRFYKNTFLGSNKIGNLSKNMKVSLYLNDNYDLYLNNEILKLKNIKQLKINNKIHTNCIVGKVKNIIINNNNDNNIINIFLNFNNYYNKNYFTLFNIDNKNIKINNTNDNKIILKTNIKSNSKITFITDFKICKK